MNRVHKSLPHISFLKVFHYLFLYETYVTKARIRRAGHIWEMTNEFNLKGRNHLLELGVDGRTLLKSMLKKGFENAN
jgi:hypothetical protein